MRPTQPDDPVRLTARAAGRIGDATRLVESVDRAQVNTSKPPAPRFRHEVAGPAVELVRVVQGESDETDYEGLQKGRFQFLLHSGGSAWVPNYVDRTPQPEDWDADGGANPFWDCWVQVIGTAVGVGERVYGVGAETINGYPVVRPLAVSPVTYTQSGVVSIDHLSTQTMGRGIKKFVNGIHFGEDTAASAFELSGWGPTGDLHAGDARVWASHNLDQEPVDRRAGFESAVRMDTEEWRHAVAYVQHDSSGAGQVAVYATDDDGSTTICGAGFAMAYPGTGFELAYFWVAQESTVHTGVTGELTDGTKVVGGIVTEVGGGGGGLPDGEY